MKLGLYPKIAADGIRKNGKLYVPYIATCILMVAVFYIMHLLGYSDMLQNFEGAGTAKDILQFGAIIMAVFGTIFLFYTQSTLIKGRKKEFGLYNVLGMNRVNLGRIIFFETAIIWFISIAGGLVAGIGLSKLAELGFTKMINSSVSYQFTISADSIIATVLVYSLIFLLIYFNALRQIWFTKTINLIHADKAGEKPPKANWVVGTIGFVILLSGYVLAIKIEQPMSALMIFFVAVILIIIGTYLVLIAGSVVLCRLLQKNKNYYYKTNHFVSVSSMAYRMKRNGAGLASICILLTMILVMISSTSALYFNREETLRNHYPDQLNILVSGYGYNEEYNEIRAGLKADVLKKTEEYNTAVSNEIEFADYGLAGYFTNGIVNIDINPMEEMNLDYDNVVQVYFFDIDDYNRMCGANETLSAGEALIGVEGNINVGDEFMIGDQKFAVAKRTDFMSGNLKHSVVSLIVTTLFVVVDDLDEVAAYYKDKIDPTGIPMLQWSWNYMFDTTLDVDGQMALSGVLNDELTAKAKEAGLRRGDCASREYQRNDFVKTFGGLFFLGILLSIIFMVSCVLIIYYKQISEGIEDQSRFEIMQKVGMTKDNIKKSINSQMLTVFLVPILFAAAHLATVLPMVNKLLLLFGHNNLPLLLISAGLSFLACGIFYAVTYKLTSNAYYKIVS
jgi:putative ABC transport system permease protein